MNKYLLALVGALTVSSVLVSGYAYPGWVAGDRIESAKLRWERWRKPPAAFVPGVVAVGDPAVSYANFEFTGDGKYMVWFEQRTDGTGRGTVWHCGVDPDSGELIPADGRGFRAFNSSALGRANPGRDSSGPYYVGMSNTGKVTMVKPTGPATGTVSVLPTPVDATRRAIYPSDLPNQSNGYVFWIKNEAIPGSGLKPGNDWFELQYISLADPTAVHVIERQDKPATGFAPMDIGFARWYRDKPTITYGSFDAERDVQVREFDVPDGTPHDVTDDPSSKIDPYPFTVNNQAVIIAGMGGTATSHVYTRSNSSQLFSLAETIYPPDSKLQNPALAQSHESIIYGGNLYSAYQVNEQGGSFFDTAFSQTGEIWLTTLLKTGQQQWLISDNNDDAKAEPEPLIGASKVWVFYSSLPRGSDYLTATWGLRRAETPIGIR